MSMLVIRCGTCGGICENGFCTCCGKIESLPDEIKSILQGTDIINYYENIQSKFINSIVLNEQENKVLNYLLITNAIEPDYYPVHIIIKNCLIGNKLTDYDNFKIVIEKLVVEFMKLLNDGRIKQYYPRFFIRDELNYNDMEARACAGSVDLIGIADCVINDLYNNGDMNSLTTIFHELTHIENNIDIALGDIDYNEYRMLKDDILREYYSSMDINYYKQNYNSLFSENYANLQGTICMMNYLNFLGLNITPISLETVKQEMDEYFEQMGENIRKIEEMEECREHDIEVLFEQIVCQNPELLESNSILKTFFINENGDIRKKNNDELENELENAKDKKKLPGLIKELIKMQKQNSKVVS